MCYEATILVKRVLVTPFGVYRFQSLCMYFML